MKTRVHHYHFQKSSPPSLFSKSVGDAVGSQFPVQGSNLSPPHWQSRVLTTGPPGDSPKNPLFLILMKSSLSIIYFINCAFGVISTKDITISQIIQVSSYITFQEFYNFAPYNEVHDPTFVKGVKVCVQIHLSTYGCPVVTAPFVEKNIYFLKFTSFIDL